MATKEHNLICPDYLREDYKSVCVFFRFKKYFLNTKTEYYCRQIRDSIIFLFEETMLHHYFSSILKSFWPGGVFVSSCPERTQEEQDATAHKAKSLLIDNIPDVLSNLVGAQTAKNGAIKMFDEMQTHAYNKQLFYVIFRVNCDFFEALKTAFF